MYFNVYWFVTEMQLKQEFGEILNVNWQAQPVEKPVKYLHT